MNLTPEFQIAMRRYLALVEILGMEHRDSHLALMAAMELAPDELHVELAGMAHEMGLMPEACGYLEDGTPMYRLEDMAAHLGIPFEEAAEHLRQMVVDREALGLPQFRVAEAAMIHRKQ